jgi:hypothetical protein
VLEGVELEGCVLVRADDVVIRNSVIRCGGTTASFYPVRLMDGHGGLLIEDSEINGLGTARVAIVGNNWTARGVNVHSSIDGVRLGSNTVLEHSYIHDLSRQPESHNDTVQTLGGSTIRVVGNTLLAYNQRTDDPMNGAVQTGRLTNPLSAMLVEANYMDGGSYTVRGGAGPRDGDLINNYVFRNNILGPNCMYGPVHGASAPVTWESNNRWAHSGEVVGTDGAANKVHCAQSP